MEILNLRNGYLKKINKTVSELNRRVSFLNEINNSISKHNMIGGANILSLTDKGNDPNFITDIQKINSQNIGGISSLINELKTMLESNKAKMIKLESKVSSDKEIIESLNSTKDKIDTELKTLESEQSGSQSDIQKIKEDNSRLNSSLNELLKLLNSNDETIKSGVNELFGLAQPTNQISAFQLNSPLNRIDTFKPSSTRSTKSITPSTSSDPSAQSGSSDPTAQDAQSGSSDPSAQNAQSDTNALDAQSDTNALDAQSSSSVVSRGPGFKNIGKAVTQQKAALSAFQQKSKEQLNKPDVNTSGQQNDEKGTEAETDLGEGWSTIGKGGKVITPDGKKRNMN
jgi:hypothetical protein